MNTWLVDGSTSWTADASPRPPEVTAIGSNALPRYGVARPVVSPTTIRVVDPVEIVSSRRTVDVEKSSPAISAGVNVTVAAGATVVPAATVALTVGPPPPLIRI